MSGIFGIYHPDSRAINPSYLQGMANGITHRGPDAIKTITQPHIGFGHGMLHTTPESISETLPYADPESGIVITADARIDNREDLCNKLGIQEKTSISDSQIILRIYKKWGVDGLPFLLGDFAFALWEPSKQRLICARDYIGVKPFYYHSTPAHFLFSSEIKQLAEYPDVPLAANEQMVAEHLSFSFCSRTNTLLQGIKRLAPGHHLIVTKQGIHTSKYWSVKNSNRIYYKKSSEYTEHFHELFKNAVTSRLRSNSPPSIQLSGGLDSSCVVGMVCNVLKNQHKALPEIYGMVFSGLSFDEQQYIKSVSDKFNLPVNYIDSRNAENIDFQQQSRYSFEPPDMPNVSMCNTVTRLIAQRKSRVLLSGIGGDELFSGSGYPYIDLFRDHKYLKLLSQLRHSATFSKRNTLKRFGINTLWPFIPAHFKRLLCVHQNLSLPSWLTNEFVKNTGLVDQIKSHDLRPTLNNLSTLHLRELFNNGTEVFFLETMDRYYASHQIEYRSPFLDQRLTEFAFAIPEYERQLSGQIKILLRNPNNTLLPKSIRNRPGKAEFSYFFGKLFSTDHFKKMTSSLSIAQRGWVNQQKYTEELSKKNKQVKVTSDHTGNLTWELWFVFAIETWYKSLFRK